MVEVVIDGAPFGNAMAEGTHSSPGIRLDDGKN